MSDEYWSDYESGPFCPHWCEPGFCDEVCKCGHKCSQHDVWGWACKEDGCECKEVTE